MKILNFVKSEIRESLNTHKLPVKKPPVLSMSGANKVCERETKTGVRDFIQICIDRKRHIVGPLNVYSLEI